MSADNGIYILESKDGFRVIHAQSIGNLWYWDNHNITELNPKYILSYFGEAKLISDEGDAFKEAKKLYEQIASEGFPIEYGIVPISGWEDKDFPT